MESLQELVRELRVIVKGAPDEPAASDPSQSVQARVRSRVREQLGRDDLRIGVEMALAEMLHEFDGFDTAPDELKACILEEAEFLLNRIESRIETDSAVNADRIEIPPPPAITEDLVRAELRAEENEAEAKAAVHDRETGPRPDGGGRSSPSGRGRSRRRGRGRGPRPEGGEPQATQPAQPAREARPAPPEGGESRDDL
ncbi:MAG: hypothetical protein M5R36_21125 [Deltaproteobacteria bacterium]|nr:hypothetical protein [Deltaproteobacteria bacterium]